MIRRAVVGVVTVLLLAGTATSAGAAAPPTARASPHHLSVRDGGILTVIWHGFPGPHPGGVYHQLFVGECSRAFTAETATVDSFFAHCTERFSRLSVHRGYWGGQVRAGGVGDSLDEKCGTTSANVANCEFAVVAMTETDNVVDAVAIAPFVFRSPKSG